MYENLINDIVNSISKSEKPKIISNVKVSFSLPRLMQSRGVSKRFKQNRVDNSKKYSTLRNGTITCKKNEVIFLLNILK